MPLPAKRGRAGTESPFGQSTSLCGRQASHWFNTSAPIERDHLLPQALRVHEGVIVLSVHFGALLDGKSFSNKHLRFAS